MPVYVPSEDQLREHLARLQEQRRVAERKAASANMSETRLPHHTADCVMIDMSMAWVQYLLNEPGKEANGLRPLLPPM
jgi:hypothetical protein